MKIVLLTLSTNLAMYLGAVETVKIVTCIYINKSTSHKNFYYLGAKCWNNLPNDLRNLPDVCCLSKAYKNRMLISIANDPNYISDNAYDNFYSPIAM